MTDENYFCICTIIPARLVRHTGLCVFHLVTLMSGFYDFSHSFCRFQADSYNFSPLYVLVSKNRYYKILLLIFSRLTKNLLSPLYVLFCV